MAEETISKTGSADAGQEIDLHVAITKLILDLKGTGTIQSLAKKLDNMPRKRLARIFEVYRAHLEGRVVPRSETDPRPTRLYWDLDPLIGLAEKLGIHVSDIIRAAEDVQDGLPPWFQLRIDSNGNKFSCPAETLAYIFLEAIGCRTYGHDPLNERGHDPLKVRGRRRSWKYSSDDSEERSSLFSPNMDSLQLFRFAEDLFRSENMRNFVDLYRSAPDSTPGHLSSADVYFVLKRVIDKAFFGVKPDEIHSTMSLLQRLQTAENGLDSAIGDELIAYRKEKTAKEASGQRL